MIPASDPLAKQAKCWLDLLPGPACRSCGSQVLRGHLFYEDGKRLIHYCCSGLAPSAQAHDPSPDTRLKEAAPHEPALPSEEASCEVCLGLGRLVYSGLRVSPGSGPESFPCSHCKLSKVPR